MYSGSGDDGTPSASRRRSPFRTTPRRGRRSRRPGRRGRRADAAPERGVRRVSGHRHHRGARRRGPRVIVVDSCGWLEGIVAVIDEWAAARLASTGRRAAESVHGLEWIAQAASTQSRSLSSSTVRPACLSRTRPWSTRPPPRDQRPEAGRSHRYLHDLLGDRWGNGCARVAPWETHPGRDGASATKTPSSSCSTRTRYFTVASRFADSQRHDTRPQCTRPGLRETEGTRSAQKSVAASRYARIGGCRLRPLASIARLDQSEAQSCPAMSGAFEVRAAAEGRRLRAFRRPAD